MVKNKILTSQINLAKDNNQNAFNFLLNTYWDDVYNFQLKRIKNESGAEDITIESFTKAFEKIHTYNDKYVFKTWLITISKNLHIDHLRKNKNNYNLIELNNFKELKETTTLLFFAAKLGEMACLKKYLSGKTLLFFILRRLYILSESEKPYSSTPHFCVFKCSRHFGRYSCLL